MHCDGSRGAFEVSGSRDEFNDVLCWTQPGLTTSELRGYPRNTKCKLQSHRLQRLNRFVFCTGGDIVKAKNAVTKGISVTHYGQLCTGAGSNSPYYLGSFQFLGQESVSYIK